MTLGLYPASISFHSLSPRAVMKAVVVSGWERD